MTLSVNGAVIPEEAIARELPHHADESDPQESAMRALVVRELLLQEAARAGIEAADEDERIEGLLEREIRVPQASNEECRRWFDRNRARFRTPDIVEASHILFELEARTSQPPPIAHAVLAEVLAHPERFPELAHRHSRCPSGAHGGNLGQLGRGETVPEFEAALFALASGAIRDSLLRTRFGFHILRVERRIDGERLPYEAVRQRIASFLDERVQQRAQQQYLKILIGRADIRGTRMAGVPTPLVQ